MNKLELEIGKYYIDSHGFETKIIGKAIIDGFSYYVGRCCAEYCLIRSDGTKPKTIGYTVFHNESYKVVLENEVE